VTTVLAYLHAPPFEFVPKEVQLQPGYGVIAVGTDIGVAEKTLAGLRAFGPPAFDVLGPMPYLAQQTMLDVAMPHGTRGYMKAHYLAGLDDEVCARIHEQTAKMPPGMSQVIIPQMGGAVARVAEDATSFGGRSAAFQAFALGIWQEEAQRDATV